MRVIVKLCLFAGLAGLSWAQTAGVRTFSQTNMDDMISGTNANRKIVADAATAADMYCIRWDTTLATLAQAEAQKCALPENALNIYNGFNYLADLGQDRISVTDALSGWFSDNPLYTTATGAYATGNCARSGGGLHVCDQYTQLIWASTTQVGCAAYYCTSITASGFDLGAGTMLTCRYNPIGNTIEGAQIYTVGATVGSACPTTAPLDTQTSTCCATPCCPTTRIEFACQLSTYFNRYDHFCSGNPTQLGLAALFYGYTTASKQVVGYVDRNGAILAGCPGRIGIYRQFAGNLGSRVRDHRYSLNAPANIFSTENVGTFANGQAVVYSDESNVFAEDINYIYDSNTNACGATTPLYQYTLKETTTLIRDHALDNGGTAINGVTVNINGQSATFKAYINNNNEIFGIPNGNDMTATYGDQQLLGYVWSSAT